MYKKGVMCVQSCSFANLNLLFFFCRSRYCRHCCCSTQNVVISHCSCEGTAKNVQKNVITCRVVVLLIKFSVFWLSRCCHHRSFIRSLLSSSQYTVPFSKYSWPVHATFLYMPGESRRKNQDIPGWIQSWEKKRIKKGNIIKFCSGFWTARFTEHVELK